MWHLELVTQSFHNLTESEVSERLPFATWRSSQKKEKNNFRAESIWIFLDGGGGICFCEKINQLE
jgi:hypothetical protein